MGNVCCDPQTSPDDSRTIAEDDAIPDLEGDRALSNDELAAATQRVENAKQITKAVFERGVRRILTLAIEGYPRALRSTLGRRNELLRKYSGSQSAAIDDVKEQAAALKEEATSFLIGAVPYVGLPASVLHPLWKATRRVCLFAAIYGFDMQSEATQAKILHTLTGMRAAAAAEIGLEKAVQMVWISMAGPASAIIPIGALVSKAANVEGQVMQMLGQDTFEDGRRPVPEEEYMLELDPEPTREDYLALAKEGTAFLLMQGRIRALAALEAAKDDQTRRAVAGAVLDAGRGAIVTAAGTAVVLGKGAVSVAQQGAAAMSKKQ